MNEKNKKLIKNLGFIIGVPLVIMSIISAVFMSHGLYPFGNGTIAWCDMTQQVIPMTADLRDILSGKTGLFMNLQNAGGMNMIGVIFFFVASPFNLLAMAVPKGDLVLFVNILTMLKLMAAGMTAMIFFLRCMKNVNPFISACFSISYAFCGYAMIYYQNSIWLDVMYLFPLLMMGIHSLVTNKKVAGYVVTLSLMAIVNYYICYMIAVFCILFFALLCLRDRKKENVQTGFLFLTGSLSAALITAVVWVPSLLQYLVSGRTTSLTDNLLGASFLTEYQSTIQLLMYSACAVVMIVMCVLDKKKSDGRDRVFYVVLVLLLIPMIVEPINLMWHTGSYMSFPCRSAFITVFIMLICCGGILGSDSIHIEQAKEGSKKISAVYIAAGAALFAANVLLVNTIVNRNSMDIHSSSRHLWVDEDFFAIQCKAFFVTAVCFGGVFLMHKKGRLGQRAFTVLLSGFVIAQSVTALNMHVVGSKQYTSETAQKVQEVFELEGKIDDDEFYRVKNTMKQFDVNNIGALGYRSLSHYTSLTDRGYIYAMKRLGYSSYWMEVGSHGGTELTDALFSVKYKIAAVDVEKDGEVFMGQKYAIYPRKNTIGFGLVTDRDISDIESFEDVNRFEVQQRLYKTLFADDDDDEIMTRYEPVSKGSVVLESDENSTLLTLAGDNNRVNYEFKVNGRQALYFDCFEKPSTNLSEYSYNSFVIKVNDVAIQSNYPSQSSNGLLYLGDYEDSVVTVELRVLQNVSCSSFGVYGLDLDKLDKAVSSAKSAQLNEDRGVITGSYDAKQGEKCIVFLPWSNTLNVEINGERVEYEKTCDDFVVFDLKEGSNDIRITNTPMGVTAGIVISCIGAVVTLGFFILRKKVKLDDVAYKVCSYAVIVIGAIVLLIIYVYPVIVNCRSPKEILK